MCKTFEKNSTKNISKSSMVYSKHTIFPILYLYYIVNHYSDSVYFLLLIDNFDDSNTILMSFAFLLVKSSKLTGFLI